VNNATNSGQDLRRAVLDEEHLRLLRIGYDHLFVGHGTRCRLAPFQGYFIRKVCRARSSTVRAEDS
jgi:hypothetical protein